MKLSELIQTIADRDGADVLPGAAVFLTQHRAIDDAICKGMAFAKYHPGRASAISHCVVLGGPWQGEKTPIYDCTIRDGKNHVMNDLDVTTVEVLQAGLWHAGGVYEGVLADYDQRITPIGIKYLPELDAAERQKLIDAAIALHQADPPYHYDIPGLVRELAKMLFKKAPPPNKRLLYCSSFIEAVYRNALGEGASWVGTDVETADVTPDDLWYSSVGVTCRFPGVDIPEYDSGAK